MIDIAGLEFHFPHSDFCLTVPSIKIADGERVAIIGPSGSGKTTLLHLISGILSPAQGTIRVADCEMNALDDTARRAFRVSHIGMVFQSFELVEYLDVFENVLLPYRLNPALRMNSETVRRVENLARETGIGARLHSYPHRLSQGEKQRAALCRALLPEPPLLLADEPTGNLDPTAKRQVVDILFRQIERTNATLLMVTHDTELAARFPRVVDCRDFTAGGAR
jgi:putative ABC transport system ATP-binding protein